MSEHRPPIAHPEHPASHHSSNVHVNPVPVEEAGARNPFPYVVGFVIAVLAIWGVMTYESRDDSARLQAERTVTTERSIPPREESVQTVEVERVETPDQIVVQAPTQERVVVVEREVDSTLSSDSTAADSSLNQAPAPASPIEVADLDYSDQSFPPLEESQLDAALNQLEADIDALESSAEAKAQESGQNTLEQRMEALEDRREALTSPLSESDRALLTQQMEELRAELNAFQNDLAAVEL